MTTEHRVIFLFLSYGLGIMLKKVGWILKSGCGWRCTFSMKLFCYKNNYMIVNLDTLLLLECCTGNTCSQHALDVVFLL